MKTKNSSAKIRIVNGRVIEEVNSAVTRLVSQSAILKITQVISLTESPVLAAVEDVAPLVEWPLKMVESMPELERRFLIHVAKVVDLTGLWGLIVARKSLLGYPGSKCLKAAKHAS